MAVSCSCAEQANIGTRRAPARLVDRSHASGFIVGNAGIMDQATVELLARRAGLDKALAEFPKDVAAAAELVSASVSRMKAPTDPRAEPWPPMRAGTGQ